MREIYRTWRGRLILLNTLVFLYLSWKSGGILLPDTQTLIALGAKDPVKLAAGEWWRLITPIFIHVGVLHFVVNSYMLNAVGRQLEDVLGGAWFMAIYLVSGVFGNIVSAVASPNLSAGASGAIFGLLGAGLFLERSIGARVARLTGQRPKNRGYLMTVAINLAFGFLVPFIDNSAHLGGLIGGFVVTAAMVRLRPSNVAPRNRPLGVSMLATLGIVGLFGAYLGTSSKFLLERLTSAGQSAGDPREGAFYYTQAMDIDDADPGLKLARARLLFKLGESRYALYDVREALEDPKFAPAVELLAVELTNAGKEQEAWEVRRLIDHRP